MKKIIKALMMVLLAFSTVVLASCEFQFVLPQPTTPTDSEKTEPTQTTEPGTDVVTNPTVPAESVIQKILEEAANLEDMATLDGERTATGTVKEITDPYSDQYKNITFVLTDGVADILVFRAKGDCAATLKVGDTVTATGEVINYGGTIEFQYATLTTENQGGTPDADPSITSVADILEAAKDLADGESLTGSYKAKGTVSNVSYNSQYGDVTFDLTDATGTIYVYAAKGDSAGSIKDGDTVTVEGEVTNYKGTIEFKKPNLYTDEDGLSAVDKLTEAEKTPIIPEEVEGDYEFISLPMALAICKDGGDDFTSSQEYYLTGWVSGVSNPSYGAIYLSDGNVSISVYGITDYSTMQNRPLDGDVVVLKAKIGTFKGNVEVKTAQLIESHVLSVDLTDYDEMSVAEARTADANTKVVVEGTVIALTYKNAKMSDGNYVANGFYLANGGDTIYVYGIGSASTVKVGNNVKVAATKDFYINEDVIKSAQKYGYAGACQLRDAKVLENDNGNNPFKENSFEETTIKELMDSDFSENITTQVFKVTALVHKAVEPGYTNYYLYDLNGTTGTYTYTQCSGSDFKWLDQYDAKLCTVLMTLCDAKVQDTGCNWRIIPVAVISDDYTFDLNNTADHVLTYYGLGQFGNVVYYANPNVELTTSVSSTLLGFENATLEYVSDNTEIATIDVVDGKTYLNIKAIGSANITITATYNGKTASATVKVEMTEGQQFDTVTVADAIAAEVGEELTLKGIVGPSLINKVGFYLFDETGFIAIETNNVDMEKIAIGNEVVIKGVRHINRKSGVTTGPGQTCLNTATVLQNNGGSHEYDSSSFATKTIDEMHKLDINTDYTTTAFKVECEIIKAGSGFSINYKLSDDSTTNQFSLYSGNQYHYQWLDQFIGQTVTLEVAACNWNSKGYYTGCVLSVTTSDGTKTINTYNFK